MEVVAEEAGPTRQLRRDRTLTTKALELEGAKHGGNQAGHLNRNTEPEIQRPKRVE